jgi:hypothetical protein
MGRETRRRRGWRCGGDHGDRGDHHDDQENATVAGKTEFPWKVLDHDLEHDISELPTYLDGTWSINRAKVRQNLLLWKKGRLETGIFLLREYQCWRCLFWPGPVSVTGVVNDHSQ